MIFLCNNRSEFITELLYIEFPVIETLQLEFDRDGHNDTLGKRNLHRPADALAGGTEK